MFTGLSSLRKAEKREPSAQNKALQDYLKKYADGPGNDGQEKKKKKKKRPKSGGTYAVSIVDADVSGFEQLAEAAPRAAQIEEAPEEEEDEPVIANPEEAEAFRVQLEKSKNFYQKSQDGSGWAVADLNQQAPQQLRRRHDSPTVSDRDLSPPRRNGVAGSAAAAAADRGRKRSLSPEDGDLSSPRRARQRHDSPPAAVAADLSPPRRGRQRHDSPGDISAPRRTRHESSSAAAAAAAAAARGDDADLSPPRRGRQRHDSPQAAGGDLSPPRRRRHGSPAAAAAGRDLSPPRRGRQRHDSPPAAAAAAAAAAAGGHSRDLSPPRRRRHDSPPGVSPPRKHRHDSPPPPPAAAAHMSPRQRPGHGSPAGAALRDLSPPRRGRHRHESPADASPPGRKRSVSPTAAAAAAAAKRMGDGTAAGLVTSRQLAEETTRLKALAEERKRQAAGRGQATVYRDKATGKIITAEEFTEQQAKARQKKAPPEEINVTWKGGLAQQRAAIEAAQQAAKEAAKSFHRGFDVDADAELKDRDRWGDPMAGKLKKKSKNEFDLPAPVITEANKAAMESSGFIVPQEVPPHSWLRRKLPAPVNRYDIRPGRHWDGVDRSNGFEKEMFKTLNQKRAQELEARMWAQEDM